MSFLAAGAILIVLGSAYAVLLKRQLAETMILAAISVVLVLFCFGHINVLGSLLYGVYFIVALAALSAVYIIYTLLKKRDSLKDAQLLKGCLLFFGLLGLSFIAGYGRSIHLWDEFSFWGTIVKHMYFADAFGTVAHPNYSIYISNYIPGTGLFQYFFTRFSYHFVEHNLYVAQNMLYFCLIMPLVKDVFSKRKWMMQVLLLVVLLMLPTIADVMFYSNLYVDAILGVFFGFSLLYYFKYRYEESLFGILIVTATVSMVVLIKHMGFVLALGILAIILVDLVFFNRRNVISLVKQESGIFKRTGKILLLLLPFISVPLIRFSWTNLVTRSGILLEESAFSPGYVLSFFSNQIEPYQIQAREGFINSMIYVHVLNFRMSPVIFSLVFLFAAFILALLLTKKPDNYRMMISSILIAFGLYCYQLTLALFFIFLFPESEAISLAGFDRYTATYLIGMLIFLLVFFTKSYEKYKAFSFSRFVMIIFPDDALRIKDYLRSWKEFTIILVSACLLIYFFSITAATAATALRLTRSDVLYSEREVAVALKKWMPYFYDEKPYWIDQGSTGYSTIVARFELMPYTGLANIGGDWSINPQPYHHPVEDLWTLIVTPDEWEQYILSNDITLIYVYHADDVLRDTFGRFFQGGARSDMVYRVENNNGQMILIPVVE